MFHFLIPVLILVAVLLTAYSWFRWSRFTQGPVLPSNARPAAWRARLAEFVAFSAFVAITFHYFETSGSIDLTWDSFTLPAFAVVVPALLVLSGRTSVAVLLFGCLSVGAIQLEVYERHRRVEPQVDRQRNQLRNPAPVEHQRIRFEIDSADVEGADLWVNGLHLGRTPVELRYDDLLDRISDWTVISDEELNDQESAEVSRLKQQQNPHPYFRLKRWLRVSLPSTGFGLPERIQRRLKRRESSNVFVRVRFEGEDGSSTFGYGINKSDGGPIGLSLSFRFPNREDRLQRLLDQARLADYSVDDEWLRNVAEFNDDGWTAVRDSLRTEPAMERVLNHWAEWKHGPIPSGRAAFDRLMELATAADTEGEYRTASVTGRAVELLATHTFPHQLSAELLRRIDSTTQNVIITGINSKARPNTATATTGNISGVGFSELETSMSHRGALLPSTLVLAHAAQAWLQQHPDEILQSSQMRDELSAALVRHHRSSDAALELATILRGAMVEQYFIRKAHQMGFREIGAGFANKLMWNHSGDVNKWWYYAACLDSSAGQAFRRHRQPEILNLAQGIAANVMADESLRRLNFVFLDNDKGERSLAARFWPQFRATLEPGHVMHPAAIKLRYLVKAEPAFSDSELIDAWLTSNDAHEATECLRELAGLSTAKRTEVLDAMIDLLMEEWDDRPFTGDRWTNWKSERQQVICELNRLRFKETDDETAATRILAELRSNEVTGSNALFRSRDRFRSWLVEAAAKRPILVSALTTVEDPKLRLLAIPALKEHPIPAYRKMLQTLREDENESVRAAANEVQTYWEELRHAAL